MPGDWRDVAGPKREKHVPPEALVRCARTWLCCSDSCVWLTASLRLREALGVNSRESPKAKHVDS